MTASKRALTFWPNFIAHLHPQFLPPTSIIRLFTEIPYGGKKILKRGALYNINNYSCIIINAYKSFKEDL